MSLKFIGNFDVLAEGKYLLEILCQLRDFGVGRMVTKGEWLRKWPEQPSYMLIRKVSPEMDRWLRRGKIWADWVYRGTPLGVFLVAKDLDRCDWHLVHKHEEASFRRQSQPFALRLPEKIPLPPLEAHLAKVRGSRGRPVPKTVPHVPHLDDEFKMLKVEYTKSSLDDATTSGEDLPLSVYDTTDPKVYLDLYGKELPCKVEKWDQ